jgi:Trk K+ transport system NAD-binding subunit
LYRQHTVVVGVGKVGYRILTELVALREPVVAIELKTESEFLEEIRSRQVAVISGNGRHRKTLVEAGVGRARAIILATDDDLANVDAALTAREINPQIHVVLRLYDETLAAKFATRFGMPAISTSEVAVPAFIAAATGRKVYHTFQLDGAKLNLTDLTVAAGGSLAGRPVGEVQAAHRVNIVMHRGSRGVTVNPPHDILLAPEDSVLVMAPRELLADFEEANRLPAPAAVAAVVPAPVPRPVETTESR